MFVVIGVKMLWSEVSGDGRIARQSGLHTRSGKSMKLVAIGRPLSNEHNISIFPTLEGREAGITGYRLHMKRGAGTHVLSFAFFKVVMKRRPASSRDSLGSLEAYTGAVQQISSSPRQ